MTLTFHGAARTVTGSKHLLSLDDGRKILLDCGMFQGLGQRTHQLNARLGFDPAHVSMVLLSHAHIDHSGLLPKMVREGFSGKIFATTATRELTEILLHDSAEIQKHAQEEWHNEPLYNTDDVNRTMQLFEDVAYDEWLPVPGGGDMLFTRTGHLLGAAAISLRLEEAGKQTTIAYSADVGRARHPLLQPATAFPQAEYIILESTYGDRHHDIQSSNIDTLLSWIEKTCIHRKGKLVIPAFSVGRTQEILYVLNQLGLEKRLPQLSYFVDSPLSAKATKVISGFQGELNERIQEILKIDDDPFAFEGLKYVESVEDSMRLSDSEEPCVIISASGTADAGRVRHHIRQIIQDPANAILFSGYCGEESLGGQLIAHHKTVEMFGQPYQVKAEIGQLKGLSAHGDADDLCQFVACQDPGRVRALFLVHGEFRVQEQLAARLSRKGFHPVQIPSLHDEIALNRAASAMASAEPGTP